ncbi:hypothetical protein GCM10008090_08590 [Arenicella chitinivorans]|uniref:TIGR02281 family clan AA aspartic protease n=1 Tax=Arenicella chitinivorans TaxID=1329800 RepID=A0A918RJR4_9GAMM|nr:TIGR02281 family clan AA aspartic protease [Arenicella chitinivorans]GHA01704.1 hypothetical protein GCM10008090_08590 [Arenicella chitinivorans]
MRLIIKLVILILWCAGSAQARAQVHSVKAIALFEGRAMLSVNSGKPKIVHAGKAHKGVKLVSSNTSEAVIDIDGQSQTLTLNSTTTLDYAMGGKPSSNLSNSVTLYVDGRGFFETDAKVNGRPLRFLVDTGANLVVLSSEQANRIGLEYKSGKRTYASTASGTAPMYHFEIDQISIGGINLYNIGAGVIEGAYPQQPLLGMTFLGRLDMNRSGNTMTLKRR